MSKIAHICFTLIIIYKQFNFCRFRASAYTNVNRLCAVFQYNICCFHDFIETSAPIERHWIILIHYKNDVNTENCFQNGGHPPSWIWENFHFWSCDLYLHVIRHLHSELHVNRPIKAPRYIKKDFQYGVRPPSLIWKKCRFLSHIPRNGNLHRHTKFDRNRIILGWDMEKKLFSKWQPSAILNLRKLPFWSSDRYLHVILHPHSEICINRPI